ncbi:hypothetical protein SDC9_119379 [bioreactor metagenome]|uniref:Uncharacterized protein n=1 Tax=bioreactor metagenome TaxID=1076179 RepID=A0A645C8N8_9ZZZZ
MQSMDNLLSVCYSFKQGQFSAEEFQSRLFTAAIPDNISKQFAKQLVNFDNLLEEIIYCGAPSSRKESAEKVADDLIQATLMEQKRLNETGSYKNI